MSQSTETLDIPAYAMAEGLTIALMGTRITRSEGFAVLMTPVADLLYYTHENAEELNTAPPAPHDVHSFSVYREGMGYVSYEELFTLPAETHHDTIQLVLLRNSDSRHRDPEFALVNQMLYLYQTLTPSEAGELLAGRDEDALRILHYMVELVNKVDKATSELLTMRLQHRVPKFA